MSEVPALYRTGLAVAGQRKKLLSGQGLCLSQNLPCWEVHCRDPDGSHEGSSSSARLASCASTFAFCSESKHASGNRDMVLGGPVWLQPRQVKLNVGQRLFLRTELACKAESCLYPALNLGSGRSRLVPCLRCPSSAVQVKSPRVMKQ